VTRLRQRSGLVLIVVSALLVLAACGEIDAEADPRFNIGSSAEGRVLFAANGDIHIWNGSTEQLTEYGDASSPVWSHNGDQFLFVRTGDAYSDLAVASADSGVAQRVTGNQPGFTPGTEDYLSRVAWALDPTWSPSGNGIAYVSDAGTDQNFLWHRRSPTSDPWRVPCSLRHSANVERPDFSPDGTKIVFAQRMSGRADLNRWMELRICDLNTGDLTNLRTGDSEDSAFFPRWSPDGEWIAFVRRLEGRSDIWVLPANDGDAEPVQLTDLGDVTAPEWSPDGGSIAFFDPDGNSFRAAVIEFTVTSSGEPTASSPSTLFSESGIDPASGMSWTE
jgi:TolB protein